MQTQTKRKGLNCIDGVILLLLAVSVASIVGFFVTRAGIFTKYKYDIEYTLRIDSIDSALAANLAVGDTLYDTYTAFPIGTVTHIESDATYLSNRPDTVRMLITVRTRAEEHDEMLSVNGVTVARGQTLHFRSPKLEYTAQCVDLSVTSVKGEELYAENR